MQKAYKVLLFAVFALLAFGGSSKAGTNVITDQSGARIVVEKPFKRIISLYGAHTENLFSLGLDKEIIGVSPDEAFPPQTMHKPVFSYHDDVEKFIAAKPDLVLVRPMITLGYPNFVKALQDAGITVVSLQPTTIEDVYAYWKDLGILTGREPRAEAMTRKFKAGLQKIGAIVSTIPQAKRKRVYFDSIHSKFMTFSASSITMFALESAGGINVATDAGAVKGTNIADYGKEHILSRAKEIDVYLGQNGAMNHASVEQIKEEAGFQIIKAVREGHIHIVDEKIVSRPTMRLLDGIYEIGRFLYPNKFNDVTALAKVPTLSRAQFAEMLCKMSNIPLKTPSYRKDILDRSAGKHKYGDFKDVDYAGDDYKFIETAVYRGIFPNIQNSDFFPDRPITRRDFTYGLFVNFDFPDVKKTVALKDVKDTDPFFQQISTAVGLGLMNTTPEGLFMPDGTVSGEEAFRIISKAKRAAVQATN
ncbi:MAG: ABC transporter substrate-binding protein [Syntrophobacteraceae bacterium]|nr:ABC transporter substrate-binding protein [Syntrophobacteraceae bacterium]